MWCRVQDMAPSQTPALPHLHGCAQRHAAWAALASAPCSAAPRSPRAASSSGPSPGSLPRDRSRVGHMGSTQPPGKRRPWTPVGEPERGIPLSTGTADSTGERPLGKWNSGFIHNKEEDSFGGEKAGVSTSHLSSSIFLGN